MKSYILTDGEWFTPEDEIILGTELAVSDWLPSNSQFYTHSGRYDIILGNISGEILILNTIKYSKEIHDDNKWNTLGLKWIKAPFNIKKFTIILQRKRKQSWPKNWYEENMEKTGWKYKILVKDDKELDVGIREDLTISKNYCIKSVNTIGENKVLGANCPIDPNTNQQMTRCLNWRRTDDVGIQCRNLLNQFEKDESITTFCTENYKAQDCRCINRASYSDYNSQKPLYPEHDNCWYEPCSSGSYLVHDQDKAIPCNGVYCQVIYETDRTGGNVTIGGQVVQNCKGLNSKNPQKLSNLPIVIIISIIVLLIILN